MGRTCPEVPGQYRCAPHFSLAPLCFTLAKVMPCCAVACNSRASPCQTLHAARLGASSTLALQDIAPTALLLRSGDAVVMAGEARRCYHGVPRIFTDRPLAAALAAGTPSAVAQERAGAAAGAEGDEGGGGFAQFAEHMRGCRINVSIRAVA